MFGTGRRDQSEAVIEDYLRARRECIQIGHLANHRRRLMWDFGHKFENAPDLVLANIPKDYPSAQDWQEFLTGAVAAWKRMNDLWGRIPPDLQSDLPKPMYNLVGKV